jgi:hypothetical protein
MSSKNPHQTRLLALLIHKISFVYQSSAPARPMAERVFNIQRWTPMDPGGLVATLPHWRSLRRWPLISGPFSGRSAGSQCVAGPA